MGLFITILHVVLCTILILIILLQPSKGSDVGAAFGGGSSSSMFGPRGAGSMLSRATTVVAILFMFTSISLALRSTPEKLSGDELEEGVLGAGLDDDILGLGNTEPAAQEDGTTVEEPENPFETPVLEEVAGEE
ncbi:MAG: preprotein translocase subunit SecG, partial [Myxococcota bacterium]|nr:preprotein translocase subunit SecG [Myxococcota bacterium]